MEKNTDSTTSRRSVLKAVGAGASATILGSAASGVASADDVTVEEMRAAEAAHDDDVRAQWVVAEQAQSVLDELATEGVLERGEVSELDFDRLEAIGVQKGGVPTGQLAVPIETETYEGELVVRPEIDEAYATVSPRDHGDPLTVDARQDDLTTAAVRTERDCSTTKCFAGCYQLTRECRDGSCDSWTSDGCCACPDPFGR